MEGWNWEIQEIPQFAIPQYYNSDSLGLGISILTLHNNFIK